MFKTIVNEIRPTLVALAVFTVLCGVVYPAAVTIAAQGVFPKQANGSLLEKNGKIVGSELIGQPYSNPKYFWGRLSATSPMPYNAAASSGSNLAPTNSALLDNVNARIDALRNADPGHAAAVPAGLVTASGSGLDPHITPEAAEFQIHRVARARKMEEGALRDIVAKCTETRTFGILGEPRVNVLKLNLALDGGVIE